MNKIFLIGRVTKDPELRYTTNGTPVCQVNLAINRPKQKDKEQETDFINVTIWNKQGENVAKYQKKGSLMAIEGTLQTRKYQDKQGKTIYTTDVIATSVQFLESKKENATQSATQEKTSSNFIKSNYTAEELDNGMELLPF